MVCLGCVLMYRYGWHIWRRRRDGMPRRGRRARTSTVGCSPATIETPRLKGKDKGVQGCEGGSS